MPEHASDQVCATLVQKLTSGQTLTAAEKAHLTDCADCMRQVVLRLDEMAEADTSSRHQTVAQPSPEVIQALEQGRRVFAREFGPV